VSLRGEIGIIRVAGVKPRRQKYVDRILF
jgi:hypothetical protein